MAICTLSEPPPPRLSPASKQTKRRSYTLEYKLSAVEWIEAHRASLNSAARRLGVDRKLLRCWVADKPSLMAARTRHGPAKKKLHSGRPPKSEELDRMVLDHVIRLKQEGVRLCDSALRSRALEYARILGITDFKAAPTWLKRWKSRHLVDRGDHFSRSDAPDPSHLSRVSSHDTVKLSLNAEESSNSQSTVWKQREVEGPVHLDFTTPDHCYCRQHISASFPPPTAMMEQPFPLGEDLTRGLDQGGPHFHTDLSSLSFSTFNTAGSNSLFTYGMPELEFTLDHEEIVREIASADSNAFMLQTDTQTSTLDPSGLDAHFPALGDCLLGSRQHLQHRAEFDDCLELPCLPSQRTDSQKKDKACKKSKRVKKKPASLALLDGPSSGLLASRLSQPVFPAEPEFVFFDHDAHTSPQH